MVCCGIVKTSMALMSERVIRSEYVMVWKGMVPCRDSYVGKDCLVLGRGASCVVSILRSRHIMIWPGMLYCGMEEYDKVCTVWYGMEGYGLLCWKGLFGARQGRFLCGGRSY